VYELGSKIELARYEQHTIEVVVDRLVLRDGIERRLTESDGDGPGGWPRGWRRSELIPRNEKGEDGEPEVLTFSEEALPSLRRQELRGRLAPRNFSFNSPYGACPECDGPRDGVRGRSRTGRARPRARGWPTARSRRGRGGHAKYFHRLLESVCEAHRIDASVPFGKLTKKQQKLLLYGVGDKERVEVKFRNRYGRTRSYSAKYEGAIPYLQRRHSEAESDSGRARRPRATCARCRARSAVGARLKRLRARGDRRRVATSSSCAGLPIGRRGSRRSARSS